MLKKLFSKINFIAEAIIKLIFPDQCLTCNKIISGLFCNNCWQSLEFISSPHCIKCSHPFEFGDCNTTCAKCLHQPYQFTKLITVFRYNKQIAKIIADFKYQDQLFLAKKLAILLKTKVSEQIQECDIVTAVPIHKKKLAKRKFNQSILLAKHMLTKEDRYKFVPDLLIRVHNDQSQTSLNRKQRQQKKIFLVNKKDLVNGKNILLIDDVFTTGATLNSCSVALKKAGAKSIVVATIAKSVLM